MGMLFGSLLCMVQASQAKCWSLFFVAVVVADGDVVVVRCCGVTISPTARQC